MATAKAERLLNLVIALVNSPRYRTAGWIREKVAGYGDAPTEEAFFRTFERDKTELRDLGIPLVTDGHDGYQIPPGEFALPQLSFTPAEKAALGLAGRLWETTALGAAGSGALRKIRDATGGDSRDDEDDAAAIGMLQPRVRTGDPTFGPLLAAVQARRGVTFEYRKLPGTATAPGPTEARSVQPWGLVSFRGRWYLVGHDTDRNAQRTFRLSRIVGPVKAAGRSGTHEIPTGTDLLDIVSQSVQQPAERTAQLLLRPGRAAGLRRHAEPALDPGPAGWDRVEMPMGHLWDTARMVAANGPDAVVEQPGDLRDAVVRVLSGAAQLAVHRRTPTGNSAGPTGNSAGPTRNPAGTTPNSAGHHP